MCSLRIGPQRPETTVPRSERARALAPRPAAAAAAAFVATLAWRFLTFTGFTNDHYAHLALAQQWLLGDRPVRDFTDPGWPLTYLLSATAWRMAGDAMWVEWALTATALAIAAACTLIAAHRLSGSLTIAACRHRARDPDLPADLLVSEAGGVCRRGVRDGCPRRPALPRPHRPHGRGHRLGVPAAPRSRSVHRHRLGGLPRAHPTPLERRRDGPAPIVTAVASVAALTAATAAFLLPWIVFVSLNGGLPAYFETALEFARAEANASNLRSWPRLALVPGQPLIGLAPPDRPQAQIQWTPETDSALRHTLEARYGLEFVRDGDEGTFYRVIDTSAGNLERLGDDPHVAGTTGLGRISRPAWRELLASVSPLRIAPAVHSAGNADAWLFWLFWSLPACRCGDARSPRQPPPGTMARRTPARCRAHPRGDIRECRFSPRHPPHPLLRRHRAAGAPRRVAARPVLGRDGGSAVRGSVQPGS